jgi:hypothetical protein
MIGMLLLMNYWVERMHYNIMANPLIARRKLRKEEAIRWRLMSHISFYTDDLFLYVQV